MDNVMSQLSLTVRLNHDKERVPTAIQFRYHLIVNLLEKRIKWFRKQPKWSKKKANAMLGQRSEVERMHYATGVIKM